MKVLKRFAFVTVIGLSWAALDAKQGPPPQTPGMQAPPPTGSGLLAGRVVDADSGEGIPGATVTITPSRSGGGRTTVFVMMASAVITDSQGRFAFGALPASQFSVNVRRDGYSSLVAQRMIEVSDGSRVSDFVSRLSKLNTISGIVRDNAGDPVVGTYVLAFARKAISGRPPAFSVQTRSRTDDHGEYRLADLPAGQYWICACTRSPIPFDGQLLTTLAARPLDLLSVARRAAVAGGNAASLDATIHTYAPTFFPNTQIASRAERITVEKGESRSGVDISVSAVRGVRVSGQVIGLPPSTIGAFSLGLVPSADLPEAAAMMMLPPMLVQSDGRFDFANVPPGTYTLEMHAPVGGASEGPTGAALAFLGSRPAPPPPPPIPPGGSAPPRDIRWATQTVVVGDDDVTGLVIATQPGITIRGKLEFMGSAAVPQAGRPFIDLMSLEQSLVRPVTVTSQVGSDMMFTFIIPPGRYALPITPIYSQWPTLKSITTRGIDILDAPFQIDNDVLDLVITFSDAALPALTGIAELPPMEIPEEWSGLVFPADRRYWKEPLSAYRRFARIRLDAQRTFTPRLPAGDYLMALTKGLPDDWMEASALEELAKTATAVTLVEGDKKSVTVKR